MKKWADRPINLREINTLRNQIFTGFTLMMILVLTFAGVFTYGEVSVLLKQSAEKHIQQTAIQANGRLDALLEQIDSLTTQVTMDSYVQNLLLKEARGTPSNFNERQSLLQIANNYMAVYSSGINSLELYTIDNKRLFPLDGTNANRLSEHALAAADEKKGRIAWLGTNPRSPDSVLAIRRINLIDHSYLPGGYLIIYVNPAYFDMYESEVKRDSSVGGEIMLLSDTGGNTIVSNIDDDVAQSVLAQNGSTVIIGEERMLAVRQQSDITGWELVLLLPVEAATEGISVLRMALYVSIGIAALAFLLLTLLLSTMITRPIQRLMRSMRAAKYGGLRLIGEGGNHFQTLEINELYNTYNQMVNNMNELIQVVYEKEITQSRTELKALQAQINPHFLFNTLEAFYWSLVEKEENELAQMILAMSGLFRYVIDVEGSDEWVTIGDELEHAQRYLQIMKMRLIDRFHWHIDADEALLHVPIPKLLIQPLVENAIQHGVESRIDPGSVTIRVFSAKQGFVTISVIDDGHGMDEEMLKKLMESSQSITSQQSPNNGAGVAISNVQRRLKLYYPNMEERGTGLRIESKVGVGTTVSFDITIPSREVNGIENDIDRR